MQSPPPLPRTRSPDWWSRNWKWFLPAIVITGGLLLSVFVMIIMGAIKSSGAYSGALARAKAAPAVIEALGSPVRESFFVAGNVHVNGAAGKAELEIPVAGPKGQATIHVVAAKAAGVWHFDRLSVQIGSTKKRIELSEKRPQQMQPTNASGRSSL